MKIEYAIILASATLVLGSKPKPQPEPHKKCIDLVCVNDDMDEYFRNAQDSEYDGMNTLVDDMLGNTTCGGSIDAQTLTRFTAIFFGDFTTTGSQDVLGSLAVGGRFTASSSTVNANHGSNNCSDLSNNLNSYGLIVGGEYKGTDINVNGAAFLPDDADKSTVQVQTAGCEAFTKQGTGIFNFHDAYSTVSYIQRTYASYLPTHRLNPDDTITQLGPLAAGFAVMTMDTCNEYDCPLYPNQLSYPFHMFLGKGDWNGVKGGEFPDTLIINVPVDVGSTIVLRGNQPSKDLTICRTIWNFYPSNVNGEYTRGGFTIVRDTGGQFGGLILAPEANIIDGRTGNFAGLTIGNDYSWIHSSAGVNLHDYQALGGDCSGILPCIVLDPEVEKTPDATTITLENPSAPTCGPPPDTNTDDNSTTEDCEDEDDGSHHTDDEEDCEDEEDDSHDHDHDHDNGEDEEDCEDDYAGDEEDCEDDYENEEEDCDDDYEDDNGDEDCEDDYQDDDEDCDDDDSHGKWKKRDEIPNEASESLAVPIASNIAANGLKEPAEAEINEGSVLRRGLSLIVPAFVAYYLH